MRIGITPAQIGSSMSSSSSFGPPVLTFADASWSGKRITRVDFSSEEFGPLASAPRPGTMCSHYSVQGTTFLFIVCHFDCGAVDRHRAEVDRMVERGRVRAPGRRRASPSHIRRPLEKISATRCRLLRGGTPRHRPARRPSEPPRTDPSSRIPR